MPCTNINYCPTFEDNRKGSCLGLLFSSISLSAATAQSRSQLHLYTITTLHPYLQFRARYIFESHDRLRSQSLPLFLQVNQSLVRPLRQSQSQSASTPTWLPHLEPLVSLAQNGSSATFLQSRPPHKPTVRPSPYTGRRSLIFIRWCHAIFASARDILCSRPGRLV